MEHPLHSVNDRASRTRRRAVARAEKFDNTGAVFAWATLGLFALCLLAAMSLSARASAEQGASPFEPLGILATPTSLALTCADGECRATLSSVSLDENGRTAADGSRYEVASDAQDAIRIGGKPLGEIEGARLEATGHYSGLRLVVPVDSLSVTGLDDRSARVSVIREVAASHLDEGGDRPLDLSSALAVLAIQQADSRAETLAGQLIAVTLAALPERDISPADAEARWQLVRADALQHDVPLGALDMADGAFARCAEADGNGSMPTASCLWSHHSSFLSVLNRSYWRAAVPGA